MPSLRAVFYLRWVGLALTTTVRTRPFGGILDKISPSAGWRGNRSNSKRGCQRLWNAVENGLGEQAIIGTVLLPLLLLPFPFPLTFPFSDFLFSTVVWLSMHLAFRIGTNMDNFAPLSWPLHNNRACRFRARLQNGWSAWAKAGCGLTRSGMDCAVTRRIALASGRTLA